MAGNDHEFGGQHTEIKLAIVEAYLKRYSAALHNWCKQVWYIDAFAGTGSRTVRVAAKDGNLFEEPVPEHIVQRRGSAQIAIDVLPQFERLVFMDIKPRHVAALRELQGRHSDRDITVLQGDANGLIQAEIAWDGWRSTRAVMFLDPYGMNVEWETLKQIAATKAIDVWYLFPLSGLYRQAAHDLASIDASKERAVTRMLGTDAWKGELYSKNQPPIGDLFGEETTEQLRRNEDVAGLERYVKARLKTVFPEVLDPFPLPPNQKPQRFSLFCAISNSSPKAISLARSFGRDILKSTSQ
ncbi:three-Cys-motif partner protein TcmP [Mesorhizobium sp.]|uniref:three-Cys-motif partner protein TcmP n=1 Tax=Mesorhizobium sp. TaxID=1871066 RepID=UPI0011FA6439|nr:three-Cys-motif partner protein TcmP [Mesorhizobium sp.]TIP12104.1 MAG: three-Cys-motif partner protein TcmP [Mesorhizobium sp.]